MIKRKTHIQAIKKLLSHNPVVALLGARQVGKTTLAREIVKHWRNSTHFFDLESTSDLARLSDPLLSLSSLKGLIVLDEIQRYPEIFPTLRVLADRRRIPAHFLVLGSASPHLLRQSSESLAGRIAYYKLPGLSQLEVTRSQVQQLWLCGGFPRSFTARSHIVSYQWRKDFIRSFLERDLPQLGITIPSLTLDRFWSMLAHYHAQLWNGSELGRAFGVSNHVVRRYLEALEATFMIRILKPWNVNLKKRQVRSPKIYIRDSGLLHYFLNIIKNDDLERHPKVGASWEGFIIENIIQALGVDQEQCYFWATHSGAEVDLIVEQGSYLRGFEIKRTVAPTVTSSMRSAMKDLLLNRMDLIHAGNESFSLGRKIRAVSAKHLLKDIK